MLNALVTSIVLAGSVGSVAQAAPCEQPAQVTITHHKPIELVAKDATFAKDGRTFIPAKGNFDRMTITADQGRTYVKQVVVRFADGQDVPYRNLDKTLSNGGSLTIDLSSHRQVKEIVVYGTGTNWYGHTADFNVTAV